MTDVSETIHKLETMNAGSNVHTINKALCYLKSPSYWNTIFRIIMESLGIT